MTSMELIAPSAFAFRATPILNQRFSMDDQLSTEQLLISIITVNKALRCIVSPMLLWACAYWVVLMFACFALGGFRGT